MPIQIAKRAFSAVQFAVVWIDVHSWVWFTRDGIVVERAGMMELSTVAPVLGISYP